MYLFWHVGPGNQDGFVFKLNGIGDGLGEQRVINGIKMYGPVAGEFRYTGDLNAFQERPNGDGRIQRRKRVIHLRQIVLIFFQVINAEKKQNQIIQAEIIDVLDHYQRQFIDPVLVDGQPTDLLV